MAFPMSRQKQDYQETYASRHYSLHQSINQMLSFMYYHLSYVYYLVLEKCSTLVLSDAKHTYLGIILRREGVRQPFTTVKLSPNIFALKIMPF